MFDFENIYSANDESELFACCYIPEQQPFFAGHFDGQPMMPAAAQIQMLNELLETQNDWQAPVQAGQNVKFSQVVLPGDRIDICVTRINQHRLTFIMKNQDAKLVSKGELILAGNNFD